MYRCSNRPKQTKRLKHLLKPQAEDAVASKQVHTPVEEIPK